MPYWYLLLGCQPKLNIDHMKRDIDPEDVLCDEIIIDGVVVSDVLEENLIIILIKLIIKNQ